MYELLTSSSSKSLKTLGSKLWLWQDVKLAKLRFEVTSLNVTWNPDLIWHGVKIFTQDAQRMNKWYAKFGGVSRRCFFAICEKPMGAHMCPPAVLGLNKNWESKIAVITFLQTSAWYSCMLVTNMSIITKLDWYVRITFDSQQAFVIF